MADPHLDHPDAVSWYVGRGPAPVIGPCPHTDCEHPRTAVVAWGPTWTHYELLACGRPTDESGCRGACRGWAMEQPPSAPGPRHVWPETWLHVDLSREHHTTAEERAAQRADWRAKVLDDLRR